MALGDLQERAARLGRYRQSLLSLGYDLQNTTLPASIVPPRLRPVTWILSNIASSALSTAYLPDLAKGYAQSHAATYWRRKLLESDLNVVVDLLRPAVHKAADDVLREQSSQLKALRARFERPGADRQLGDAARRILTAAPRVPESVPGGTPSTSSSSEQITMLARDAHGGDEVLEASDAGTEKLPGGTPAPAGTPTNIAVPDPRPTTRDALLYAIAAERKALAERTDSRPAPSIRNGVSLAPDAADIPALLAVLSVHPRAGTLFEAYARSPRDGALALAIEIDGAIAATEELRSRLTGGADADDSWRYGPLVLVAVRRVGLADVPGFPEFAVALGTQLGRTRTDAVLEAAGLLLIGLSIAFTGPVGAALVGVADLAVASVGLGVALLKDYEEALAGRASDFREKTEAFNPGYSAETGMAVAAAFLAALGLLGAARGLLSARPRSAREVAAVGLGHRRSIPTTQADIEAALAGTGPRRSLVRRSPKDAPPLELDDAARGVTHADRGLEVAQSGLSEQQMRRRGAAAAQETGARRLRTENRDSRRMERFELTPEQVAAADRGTVRELSEDAFSDVSLSVERPTQFSYGEVDLDAISLDVTDTPVLTELPRSIGGRRIMTREGQAYDALWERPLNDPELTAWARRQLPQGSLDPIAPWIRVGPDNPAVADHIVPVERLRQFDGFVRLDRDRQLLVLNDPENIAAVSSTVNSSRGSRSFAEGEWVGPGGRLIPADVRATWIARERDAANYLQARIRTLLAEQNAVRGTARPAPGAPGAASRSLAPAVTAGGGPNEDRPPPTRQDR